jgi:hypothetical protein
MRKHPIERLRAICLALPDEVEKEAWGDSIAARPPKAVALFTEQRSPAQHAGPRAEGKGVQVYDLGETVLRSWSPAKRQGLHASLRSGRTAALVDLLVGLERGLELDVMAAPVPPPPRSPAPMDKPRASRASDATHRDLVSRRKSYQW